MATRECEIDDAKWQNIDLGGKFWRIAANMKSDVVWAMSRKNMFNHGYRLYMFQAGKWV
jgi:hypothetical protein